MSRNILATVSISILAGQAPLLLKPIIAGKLLGGQALAAISLTAPVLEVCYALIFLLAVGTSYLITECVSVNDILSARKHFSVCAIATLAAISLLSMTLLTTHGHLSVVLGGNNPVLSGLVKEYMCVIALSFIPIGLFNIYTYNFLATGELHIVVQCSVAVSVTDIVLSVVFVKFFQLGIVSFAWPVFISTLLGSVILMLAAVRLPYFRLADVRHDFSRYLVLNVRKGLPLMIDDLLCIVMFLSCNLIVVNKIGGNAPIVWSIASYFVTAATILMNIISEATMTLGAELRSTGDYRSCHQMIRRHRFVINILVVFIWAVVELFPGAVMTLFGEPGMADPDTCHHLQMAVPIMAITSIVMFEATNYYLLDKSWTYLSIIAVIYMSPVLMLLLFSTFSASCAWWAFPVCTAASLTGAALISKDVDKRITQRYRDTPSVDESVPYAFSAVGPLLESVKSFLNGQGIAPGIVNAAVHCIDELSYNIIKHAPRKHEGRSFSIRVAKVDDAVIVLCKYGGQPFNPIMSFDYSVEEAAERGTKLQLALRIFNHYAISPWYQYRYGINTLAMRLSKDYGIQKADI